MSSVCVIPARGGSKRIPRKNIKEFCGKPMIAWAIEAARRSEVFDTIVVSTDDDEVAAVAERCGAEVPFRRPAALADDRSGLNAVLRHAIGWLAEHRARPEFLACVYATAPLLRAQDLRNAHALLAADAAVEFVVSVASFPSPVHRALTTDERGCLRLCWPQHVLTRSQDLPETFHDAGQFVLGRAGAFLAHESALGARTLPYVVPRRFCQDIDTPEDWDFVADLWKAVRQTA